MIVNDSSCSNVRDSWNYHQLSSTIMTVWTGLNSNRCTTLEDVRGTTLAIRVASDVGSADQKLEIVMNTKDAEQPCG